MFVPVSTKATRRRADQGIIVQSGNDAAICLAESLGGNEDAVRQAHDGGGARASASRSRPSRMPTGLFDPEQLMTARELAMLARTSSRNIRSIYPIFAQKEFNYRKHKFINRNPLLGLESSASTA